MSNFYTSNAILKRSMSFSAKSLLSKGNKETCIRKFQGMLVQQGSRPTAKRAAVLVPIYIKDDEVSLLYTLRAASLRAHRGQVSFPGGMVDTTDKSLEQTALRETQEELGLDPKDIEIWGKGNPIIRQDLSILPLVGCIKKNLDLTKLKISEKEVEKVFTVKIKDLVNPKFHRHTQFRGSYSTPTYLAGPYRIWGLTAVITFMFLKSLIPNKGYAYQIRYIPDVLRIVPRKTDKNS